MLQRQGDEVVLGQFLRADAPSIISTSPVEPDIKAHALEVIEKSYTIIRNSLPGSVCRDAIAAFRDFERVNVSIFSENRDTNGHCPRIINLHC